MALATSPGRAATQRVLWCKLVMHFRRWHYFAWSVNEGKWRLKGRPRIEMQLAAPKHGR